MDESRSYFAETRKKKTLLITGITGKSGAFFLKRLTEENPDNYLYKAIVRQSSNTGALDACGLPVLKIYGDLTDTSFFDKAFKDVDTLLHIAGIKYSPQLVDAAIRNNVKRLILVHTTGIYSKYKTASSEYLEIERSISDKIKDKDISLTILMPTMIYGSPDDPNISKFIRMVDRLPFIPVVAGAKFALQPVHQRDLGNAYFDVLTDPEITANKNYVLSGSYPIDLIDILLCIAQYLGKKPKVLSIPFWLAYTGAFGLFIVSLGKLDIREKVQRLVESRAYSHEEAKKDFGYTPVNFKKGLKQEVEDYLAQKK